MSQEDPKSDLTAELSSIFHATRNALRTESRHEGDIVRIDLDGLEESVKQASVSSPGYSNISLDSLLSRLEGVRQEARSLYIARDLVLAELAKLEKLLLARRVPVERNSVSTAVRSVQEVQANSEKMHRYFLSYSRVDAAAADHLESLLRRQARMVLRDEVHFEAGRDLNEAAAEAIRSATTFVALWSKSYKGSSWCLGELSYFRDFADRSGTGLRLVLVELDDEDIYPRFSNVLRLSGENRFQRELAVAKIVAEE